MASFPAAAAPARVYVDVETTGFRGGAAITSAYHRVVQLSAGLGAPYDPDAAFDTLVHPNIHVPAASTAIHGIDDDVSLSYVSGERKSSASALTLTLPPLKNAVFTTGVFVSI